MLSDLHPELRAFHERAEVRFDGFLYWVQVDEARARRLKAERETKGDSR